MAKFSWNTPLKNKDKVLKRKIHIGDIVKITETANTGGLEKNGRTGVVTRIENEDYEVKLHCTHTGGYNTKSKYIKELDRYVGETTVKKWFNKKQIIKI